MGRSDCVGALRTRRRDTVGNGLTDVEEEEAEDETKRTWKIRREKDWVGKGEAAEEKEEEEEDDEEEEEDEENDDDEVGKEADEE